MSKHSPKPWEYESFSGNIWDAKDNCIAEVVGTDADASLIVEAPNLLLALQQMVDYFDDGTTGPNGKEILDDARAAIAKAEGKS